MNIDINKNKTKEYKVGDLLETDCGYRMIVRDAEMFGLMDMEGSIVTNWYPSIDRVLTKYEVLESYRNTDLKMSLK